MRRVSDAHVPRNYCRGLFDLQVSHGRKTLHQSSCAFIGLLTDDDYLASRSVTLNRFETLRKGFRPVRGGDYDRDIFSRGHFVFPERLSMRNSLIILPWVIGFSSKALLGS